MLTPSLPPSRPPGSSDDELLNDLLDERLGTGEARALEARLEREPLLREAYDELLRTRELFRAAPDPLPPADFTARVRARLDAEPVASTSPAGVGEALEPRPDPALELAPKAAPARPVEVPRLWKRLMVTAYAAAALLMVGIGVVSLRRGSQRETDAGHAPAIETARGAPSKKDEAQELGAAPDRSRTADDAKLAAPLLPGLIEDEREKTLRVGEPAATGGAAGRGAPRLGPGGSVRPGLREPSDVAPAPPAAVSPSTLPPAALPPAAPAPAPTAPDADPQASPAPSAEAGKSAPELAAALPPEPLANVLLLEAPTAVAGRALVAQVLAGPGARGADAEEAPTGFTRVLLRRADVRADGVLLARLRVSLPAKDGAPSADASLPKEARPPAPAAAPSASPPTTPPGSGPVRLPAGGAAASGPTVLADFWQDLNAEQQARLEALLGPLPASAPAPAGGGAGGAAPAAAPSVPRRVRIVITAPHPASPR